MTVRLPIDNIASLRSDWGGRFDRNEWQLCTGLGGNFAPEYAPGAPICKNPLIETNILSMLMTNREALRLLRQRGDKGYVVLISSYTAHRSRLLGSKVYAASKAALKSIADGLRQELHAEGSNLHVSCIAPGFVDTALSRRDIEVEHNSGNMFEPLAPDDIGDLVRYVVSLPGRVSIDDIIVRRMGQLN